MDAIAGYRRTWISTCSGDYDDGFDDHSLQNHAYTAITTTCGDLFIVDYVFTCKNVSLSNVSYS